MTPQSLHRGRTTSPFRRAGGRFALSVLVLCLATAASPLRAQAPLSQTSCPPLSGSPPSVLTSQYDNCRDAYNPAETILTPASVYKNGLAQAPFPPLYVDYSASVLPSDAPSNPIYAQPLYVAGISLKNITTVDYAACPSCNMLVAVTLNDTVFAWNADTGALLWSIQTGSSGSPNWVTQQPLYHDCGTTNVGPVTNQYTNLPFAGILSTPVIDASGSPPVMFLVSECSASGTRGNQFWLHKIDLTQGVDVTGSPVLINPTAAGADDPDDWVSGAVQFNGVWELQRPALLEVTVPGNPSYSPLIYVAFGVGIQETTQPYQGWVVGYNTSLTPEFAFVSDPTGNTSGLTPPCCQGCYACSTDQAACCTLPPSQCGSTPPCCPTTCVPYMQGSSNYFQNSPSWCRHGGGIWMSGRGPAASTLSGTSYTFLGLGNGGSNGTWNSQQNYLTPQNYAQSLINFQLPSGNISQLQPAKYFTTYGNPPPRGAQLRLAPSLALSAAECPNEGGNNQCQYTVESYNENDWDSASSGVLLFHDQIQGGNWLLTVDKAGYGHLLREGAAWQGFMQYDPDDQFPFGAAQTLCTGSAADCDRVTSVAFDSNGEVLYFWPNGERLTAFPFGVPSGTGTPGPGTIHSSGTTVYAESPANFLGTFIAGGTITNTDNGPSQSEIVTAVASDGSSLTISQAFSSNLPSGTTYSFQGYFVNPIFDQNPKGIKGYPGGSVLVTSNSGSNELVWALARLSHFWRVRAPPTILVRLAGCTFRLTSPSESA